MTNKSKVIPVNKITADKLPITVGNRIIEIMLRKMDMEREHHRESKKIHHELWDAVHEEYPRLDKKANYSLDTSHIAGRIVVLERGKRNSKKMNGLIAQLISDL